MSPVSVGALHAAVRKYLARGLGRLLVLAGGVAVTGLLVLAWLLSGGEGWDPGSPLPLVLDLLALVTVAVGLRAFVGARRRVLAESRISRAMERASGVPEGVLQGALELGRELPPGVSGSLVDRSERSLLAGMPGEPETLAGELGSHLRRRTRGFGGALTVLVPALLLLLVASPERSQAAWSGLARPIRTFLGPELPPLEVLPGDAEVRRGDAVTVRIVAPFREAVTLHWQSAGDVARTAEIPIEGDSASHLFPALSAGTEYWVAAPDGARTPIFRLVPVDPLLVSDVLVRLRFPAYIGRPSEELRGDVPPLLLPAGTEVGVEGRASRPLSLAELQGGTGGSRSLEVDGAAFRGSWTPNRSQRLEWSFLDAEGAPAALVPPPLEIALVPDSVPRVSIALPAPDTVLPAGLRQPLVLEARDDHGLRSLELVAWRVTALGDSLEPVSQTLDLGGSRAALARPLLDVSSWGLVPGDQVRYFARVTDIHPAGQTARSAEYVLRMPTPEEMRREAQGSLENAAERLRELQDEALRAAEETREMERTADAPERGGEESRFGERTGSSSFQEQESVRQAVEDQQAMAARADSLGGALSELSESLREAGASDPELQEDLQELQDLLREVGGDELQDRLRALLEEMDEEGRDGTRETLEQLAEEQEAFRERIEEALERAQRAAVEQDFRSATEEARELAEEQEALARTLEEAGDDPRRADQQEEILGDTEGLEDRMERLQERLQELGEERAAERMEEARRSAASAREGMQEAARQAREGSTRASSAAQQAAAEMSEAARELQAAQEQMMAERARAFQEALERTTRDALALAREQSGAREAMAGASREELAELRGDVAAVRQGVRSLAENVSLAARLAGADEREMLTGMGRAMEALDGTLEALERPGSTRPSATAAAERAVGELNDVARTAMAAIAAMSEGGEQGAMTTEQMMEQLEQLAQQQADVNNQAAQMMPMELTPQAQQEQMQQMSQQQQQVASDLGQLSNQEGEEGPLGDLEAMAREAVELAERLQGGRLDRDTRDRQERLFHRLLDAGRSLEREEESTERESDAPAVFERGVVPPLQAGDLGLARFRLPDAAALSRLPPAARALVLRYFRRLNEPAGGGGG